MWKFYGNGMDSKRWITLILQDLLVYIGSAEEENSEILAISYT